MKYEKKSLVTICYSFYNNFMVTNNYLDDKSVKQCTNNCNNIIHIRIITVTYTINSKQEGDVVAINWKLFICSSCCFIFDVVLMKMECFSVNSIDKTIRLKDF